MNIFPHTCSAAHPFWLFWSEFLCLRDISHKDVCLLAHVMELDDTWLVVLKAPKIYIWKNSNDSFRKAWPDFSIIQLLLYERLTDKAN